MKGTEGYRSRLESAEAAQRYATRFERGRRRQIDRREQRAVRRILDDLPDCRSVLDVPCGAGRFLATLAANGRSVTGIDASAEILALARRRAEQLGIPARFEVGDAARLAVPDSSVDAVFCNRLLHHITVAEERAVFLREFHRVTRRHVVVSFFDYRAWGGLRRFLKALKGRRADYDGQPTLREFDLEVQACGFRVLRVVPTGPLWVSEKYFVLTRRASDPTQSADPSFNRPR
ncbi:MAG TPA: class I SAM-dependent methyltransferase [Verrucomicrobiota bacterium]|nr:class I SAM-dependent methyltransferase [Verrucomicrobiota bacterium]HNU50697.1 class I SAM-dependent methyltransferase [Verrucomicrobiota bacterium]